jgi:DNA methylase
MSVRSVRTDKPSYTYAKCLCTVSQTSHFACFPQALVEPCILAGTSERGACLTCGVPWRRVVESLGIERRIGPQAEQKIAMGLRTQFSGALTHTSPIVTTIGWKATCACPSAEPVPCRVLDPFAGSGTTVAVAERLGRVGIGMELNPAYLTLARQRTMQRGLL